MKNSISIAPLSYLVASGAALALPPGVQEKKFTMQGMTGQDTTSRLV